jgi:hypothetical protein
MFFDNSTRRAMAGLLFSLLSNLVSSQPYEMEIFPKVENGEMVIEAGSTLTLICVKKLEPYDVKIEWLFDKKNLYVALKYEVIEFISM